MEQRSPTIAQWQCVPIIVAHLLTVSWAVISVVDDIEHAAEWWWLCSVTGVTLSFSALVAKDRVMLWAGLSTGALCVVLFVMDHKLSLGKQFWRSWSWAILFPYEIALMAACLTEIRLLAPLPSHARRFQFSIRYLIVQTIALSLAFGAFRFLNGILLGFQGLPGGGSGGSSLWDDPEFGIRMKWQTAAAIANFLYICVCMIDAVYCALCDGLRASGPTKPKPVQQRQRDMPEE